MSKVMYDSKRLIPAPLVSISKEYQKTDDGTIVGKTYTLILTGTIVAYKGSPSSSGTFWTTGGYPTDETVLSNSRLSAIQRKQEAIRDLFSVEGKHFEIQALDGTAPVKCNPRITSISFPEGTWYDRSEYSITLETDELYGGVQAEEDSFNQYISSAKESWSIDTNDDQQENDTIPRIYTFTHNISAVGKRFYGSDGDGTVTMPAWQQARNYVVSRLGFDNTIALSSGVNNLPSYYNGYNHVRNEQFDEDGGSFSVTESWVLASGSATESFDINTTINKDEQYSVVSINGNIQGFESRDSNLNVTSTKWENANSKFTFASGVAFTRAQTFSGLSLNILPLNTTIGRNPVAGSITYSYEYNNRPMSMISGVKNENIQVSDNVGGQLFASIFVLGRTSGPVLQNLSTKPSNTRALNIEITIDAPIYSDRTVSTLRNIFIDKKPSADPTYSGSIQNIIEAVNPSGCGFSTVFQNQPQETWIPKEGRYSYTCEWTYE